MAKARIILSNPVQTFNNEIYQVLSETGSYEIAPSVDSLERTTLLIKDDVPSILIIGPDWPLERIAPFISGLIINHPHVAVITVLTEPSTETLKELLKAGARDVLDVPISKDQLHSSVEEAIRFSATMLERLREKKPEMKAKKKAPLIVAFSTKGGVGKTVLCTNLAVSLAQRKKEVILVDLSLQSGDVAIMLGIEPGAGIYEASRASTKLDREMLDALLKKHGSGVKAVLAPVDPDLADEIERDDVRRVLEKLRELSDFVIVDTSSGINDTLIMLLNEADIILLLTTMDLPSIKNTKIAYQLLKMMKIPPEKIKLILNRADSKVGLAINDVENAIGAKVYAQIPSDRLIPKSVNMSTPVVLGSARTEVAKSLEFLAEKIFDELKGSAGR